MTARIIFPEKQKMKKFRIACFKYKKECFISQVTIENRFLFEYLPEYAQIVPIVVENREDMINQLSGLTSDMADFFYINARDILLESFLIREKNKLQIPFILILHSVFGFKLTYPYIIPLIREYDLVTAPSEYARKSFQQISKKPAVHVTSNCLDLKMIRKNVAANEKKRDGKIVFMGQLVEGKGVDTIIDCMPEIVDKVKQARLDIIGPLSGNKLSDNPVSSYVKYLQEKVCSLKLERSVAFTGVKTGKDKYAMLAQADVFVSPSIAPYEAQPVVNLEAQACGVPVVTSDWAGNRETVDHGINGFLVDAKKQQDGAFVVDKSQLASSVISLLTDEHLNESFRSQALKKAENYDYHHVLPQFINLLKNNIERESTGEIGKAVWEKSLSDFRGLFEPEFYRYLELFLNINESYGKLLYDCLGEYIPCPKPETSSNFDPFEAALSSLGLSSPKQDSRKLRDDFSDYINLRK